ncbi:fluoride efflux transporter CrcB [Bacillus niameyensis]|uniref:fluoride efflux transporter CrcB n=1 Tax=Bacillus niameyensis TaxID=1522308 RepID=UPI0007861240|nr:fluoride efflux transporter CrcB [Bacillus niameyensis]
MNILFVAIGGFFGAISRFGVNNWIKSRFHAHFPIATLMVNLVGSFLLGLLIGAKLGHTWELLLGTGFMGAFTTFSTFKLDSIQLWNNTQGKSMTLYLSASYTFGILLALIGMRMGMMFG